VVVDRHPMFRQGVVLALQKSKALRVVGSGSTRSEALRLTALLRPDVLVLDVGLLGPETDDWGLAQTMRQSLPDMKIICLTPSADVKHATAALKLGVPGYVLKSVDDHQLCQIVRDVHDGALHINPDRTAYRLALKFTGTDQRAPDDAAVELTNREDQILSLVAFGLNNSEIARVLDLTPKSVTHSMSHIMRKLNVRNRTAAVLAQQPPPRFAMN